MPRDQRSNSTVLALSLILGLLCVMGLVMVLSASAAEAQSDYGNPWYQFQRQAMWLAIGAVVLVVASLVDYGKLRSMVRPMLAATVGLLLLVLAPFAGQTVNGSSRWLALGPVTLQPSELAKLALIVFVANLLASREGRMTELRVTVGPVLVVFGVMAVLILAQPNLGTTVLLFVIVAAMLWVAGVPGRVLGMMVAVAGMAGMVLAVAEPYRWRRLVAFADPWADPLNAGYQTLQSQAALATGGATGLGLGQGRAKFGFLPEGHTDFIFSTIGEELGLLGGLVLMALVVGLAYLGGVIALRARDRFGMLMAVGITTWIVAQALVNLGAAVGVLPITGVPLPLVSSGGSSLIVTMAACGVLLNIARTSQR
jgi:cell division protein FtsW